MRGKGQPHMILPGLKYYFESGKLIPPVPVPKHRLIHSLCLQTLLAASFGSSIYRGEDLVFSLGLSLGKGSQTSGRDTGVWKPLHVYLY